jgi:serine/threonine-protein kinase HipA
MTSNDNSLNVYFEDFSVGELLIARNGRVSFRYDPRWQQTRAAFPASVTMPLQQTEHDPGIVEPWLANLLPEEAPLRTLAHLLGVDGRDVIAFLKAIGGDTAGALSFGPPSPRVAWRFVALQKFYADKSGGVISIEAALARHFEDLATRPFLAGEDGVRVSLAGGQEKTALAVIGPDGQPKLGLPGPTDTICIPLEGAPSTIILKPDNPRLQGIVENEAYCLALAEKIGLPTVKAVILNTNGRTALVVARYDRVLRADGSIRRLHQEDFAQANTTFPRQKYERGTLPGPSLATLLATRKYLDARNSLALVDQVIFNLLVCNTDAHAKNYSLMFSPSPSLAPLYDVSSVLTWDHVNQYAAQNLAGKKRKPGDLAGRHWDAIAEAAGLNPRELRQRVDQLAEAMFRARPEVADTIARQAGAIPALVLDVAAKIEANLLRIQGRL